MINKSPDKFDGFWSIGLYFVYGGDGIMWYAESGDWRDINLVNIEDPTKRKAISSSALGRIYHEIYTGDIDGKPYAHAALGGWTRHREFLELRDAFKVSYLKEIA